MAETFYGQNVVSAKLPRCPREWLQRKQRIRCQCNIDGGKHIIYGAVGKILECTHKIPSCVPS
jgi:hypothetical protein